MGFKEDREAKIKRFKVCHICGRELDVDMGHASMGICDSPKCFSTDFWIGHLAHKNDENVARIKGLHYIIGEEDSKDSFRGFAGRKFYIKFNNGILVKTSNLWHQGTIPEFFKQYMQDNAKFLTREEYLDERRTNEQVRI